MNYSEKIKAIDSHRSESIHAERICSQIVYLDNVSKIERDLYNGVIEAAADHLLSCIARDGVITIASVAETEELLMVLQPAAKRYKASFISHAHIDMNWMWGYNETVSITVDTFRTILQLMEEHPDFTYAQSQASTYEIIEKYAPEMLPEIKRRIHEGRWEVTASEWVEPDKNMPNGESLTRQILQTKKYLCKLLDLPADYFILDFVPDTFGHNANIPEILSNAGIRYMYHCRGYDGMHDIYRYVSPSGKSILTYREYEWYNSTVTPLAFEKMPGFCEKNQVSTCLCVYGVGDHGGGPSRRDIERILTYQSWPLTPTITFGTFRGFFKEIESCGHDFPIINSELNCIFTGCYTTQSRIKMANRLSEARMNEAEALSAMASGLTGFRRNQDQFDGPWRNLLFNHFHDILPGSGTIETREYAMGRFQEILAVASTSANRSMQQIASQIDTTGIAFDSDNLTTSEGGGVGYFQSQTNGFRMPSTERGRGKVRVLHVFNPTGYDRKEVTELTLWDYPYDLSLMLLSDANGNPLEFQLVETGKHYWGHQFTKFLAEVSVPAYGYTTVIVSQKASQGHLIPYVSTFEHSDEFINDEPIVMENEYISAIFDRTTMRLISLTEKQSGQKLINQPSCFFQLIQENPLYNMTSWRVGPYMNIKDLNSSCNVKGSSLHQGALRQWFDYEIKFGNSVLKATVSLNKGSKTLDYDLTVDWDEAAVKGERIPQLSFAVPVSYQTNGKCTYDIPYGVIARKPLAHDVPALSYLSVGSDTATQIGILSDTKYGYRCWNDQASVTLIRSAYDPDPYPERGIHNIRLAVACVATAEMNHISSLFNHPLCYTSGNYQNGPLSMEGAYLRVEGATVSCVKISEDNSGSVVRVYNSGSDDQIATLEFMTSITEATLTDTNEYPVQDLTCADNRISVNIPAYSVITVKVK